MAHLLDLFRNDRADRAPQTPHKMSDLALFCLSLRKVTAEVAASRDEFDRMAGEQATATGMDYPWDSTSDAELKRLVAQDEDAMAVMETLGL